MRNRWYRGMSIVMAAVMLTGAGAQAVFAESTEITAEESSTELAYIDNTKWLYNEEDDVYYQIGISYCATPADADYETLAIFVPGAYMTAADNGDGTYTCEINTEAVVGNYTAETAPIVMPVNTPGYSAQAALTDYQSFTEYTSEGMIYVHAGCRGRDAGAPAGVTDLKAAIRYIRYNDGLIAGDTEKIFSFGMSGGGAQSALLGVTGDSELYDDYLEAIGAVMTESDALYGSMAWCPITSLDTADEAYEWNMGTTRSDLTEEEQAISDALTEAYAEYINSIGLTDSEGNVLTLEQSEDGLWQAGSYYEYVKEAIEASLNQFLAETEFPYDASSSSQGHQAGMGGMDGGPSFGDGEGPNGKDGMKFDKDSDTDGEERELKDGFDGMMDGQGSDSDAAASEDSSESAPADITEDALVNGPEAEADAADEAGDAVELAGSDEMSDAEAADQGDDEEVDFTQIDDISRTESSGGITISGTYETAQDYIDALNANGEWVIYDAETNTATITSVQAFAQAMKNSAKGIAAFDQLDAGQGENTLFNTGDGEGAHFDSILANILSELGSEYADDYAADLEETDELGHTAEERLNMYSPLYYLLESSEGYGTSTVAQYFRIRTGISQSDTSVTTELNLAQALENEGVDVDFAMVWGQEHTMAETSGSSTTNFIEWINECMAQ